MWAKPVDAADLGDPVPAREADRPAQAGRQARVRDSEGRGPVADGVRGPLLAAPGHRRGVLRARRWTRRPSSAPSVVITNTKVVMVTPWWYFVVYIFLGGAGGARETEENPNPPPHTRDPKSWKSHFLFWGCAGGPDPQRVGNLNLPHLFHLILFFPYSPSILHFTSFPFFSLSPPQ